MPGRGAGTQRAGILSPVRLLSSDEASVELSIGRYQFPDLQGHGDRDWDANWLQMPGEEQVKEQAQYPDGPDS